MTSVRRTGAAHLRGGSMPARTRRRLGVAAHAGGEVVEAEEVGEGVGVGFVGFEFGDEVELAAEQVLVAAAEVDEAVGDVAAEDGLFDGEVEGGVLHGVEGVGDVGDFVAGVDRDGVDGGHGDVVAEGGFEDVEHGVGQAVLGHVLGLTGQRPQRLGDRPRHQPRDDGGDEHGGAGRSRRTSAAGRRPRPRGRWRCRTGLRWPAGGTPCSRRCRGPRRRSGSGRRRAARRRWRAPRRRSPGTPARTRRRTGRRPAAGSPRSPWCRMSCSLVRSWPSRRDTDAISDG